MNCTEPGFFATYDCCMSTLYLNMFGSISSTVICAWLRNSCITTMYPSTCRQPLVSMAFIFLFFLCKCMECSAFCICTYMHLYGHVYIYKCVYTCVFMCMRVRMCTYVCLCVYTYMHLRDKAQLGTCALDHAHYCGELRFRKWKNNQHMSMHQSQRRLRHWSRYKLSLFHTESW